MYTVNYTIVWIKHYEKRIQDLHYEVINLIGVIGSTSEVNKRIISIHKAHVKLNRWKQRKFQAEQFWRLYGINGNN